MQKLLLLLCLTLGLSYTNTAQQLRFGRAYKYNLVDIKYGNPEGPSMSSFTYENCCWWDSLNTNRYTKPAPVSFGAWVVNTTHLVKHNVYLKVHSSIAVLYSDTISLQPGDSIKLVTPSLKTVWLQGASFYLYEGTNLITQDSLPINQNGTIGNSRLSHYFGDPDNFIGTTALGDDGAGFAILYPMDPNVALTGFSILTGGTNSVAGGDVLIEIYDSSAFTPNGFVGNPLYTSQLNLYMASGWRTEHFSNWVYLNTNASKVKYIWLVVKLFSNGGFNSVEIGNSQKGIPSDNSIWYLNVKGNSLWKKANDTTEHLMNPIFHLNTFVPHWDPAPFDFTINEEETKSLSILPNPASHSIRISLPQSWRKASIKVFSLSGHLVLETQLTSGESLNTSALKPGFYLLSAEEKGVKRTVKLLIE